MKHFIRTALLTSCLALAPTTGALANGGKDGNSDPFGKNAKKESTNNARSSGSVTTKIIDGISKGTNEEGERLGEEISSWQSQRSRIISNITGSPIAGTPTIREFLTSYRDAPDASGRSQIIRSTLNTLWSHLRQFDASGAPTGPLAQYATPYLASVYVDLTQLYALNSLIAVGQQVRENALCSGRYVEALRDEGKQPDDSAIYHCFETAQR